MARARWRLAAALRSVTPSAFTHDGAGELFAGGAPTSRISSPITQATHHPYDRARLRRRDGRPFRPLRTSLRQRRELEPDILQQTHSQPDPGGTTDTRAVLLAASGPRELGTTEPSCAVCNQIVSVYDTPVNGLKFLTAQNLSASIRHRLPARAGGRGQGRGSAGGAAPPPKHA
jgi:hypothetical protein